MRNHLSKPATIAIRNHLTLRKVTPEPNWDIVLPPIDETNGPRYLQLMRALIRHIETHHVPSGVRLPSSRQLAYSLGVGRNTVILAFDALIEQGYLISKNRSGIRVANLGRPSASPASLGVASSTLDWTDRFSFTHLDGPPFTVDSKGSKEVRHSFLYGQFDQSLFPIGPWRECERAALGVLEIAHWGRDMVDEDDQELVDQLRANVLPYHGIWAKPDEILVTLGGQEGRYLVARLLCKSGVRVGIENPGMPDMNMILGLTGATRVYLDVDGHGMVPSSALDSCNVVFTTAGHQCPTAVTMPVSRRLALLESAKQQDFVIVEDTFETESLLQTEDSPSLKSMDDDGRVIYIGSLSKLLAPGLRIGVVVAPPVVIQQLRALRRLIHRHPPGNTQRALAIFIERGYYRSYVRRAAKELDNRGSLLESELRKQLPDFRWYHQSGTANFWIEMPLHVDGQRLASAAKRQGVLIEAGDKFYHCAPRPTNFLRVGISSATKDSIKDGVRILAELYRSFSAN